MKRASEFTQAVVAEIRATLSRISDEQAAALVDEIEDAEQIIVAGAGRSGLMARAFCMRLMHLGLHAYVAGEMATPALGQRDLLFVASGSGATESLVAMAEKAKNRIGARLALVGIDASSPIARLADAVLVIPAPSPKIKRQLQHASIQPLGSLFEQSLLLVLDALVLLVMERKSIAPSVMFGRHANLE